MHPVTERSLGKNVFLSDKLTENYKLVTNDEEVIDKLKSLDLSTYEALSYYTLLKLDTADVNKILYATHIPTGRIYDVLNSLVNKGLSIVQETRPKKYSAVDPSVALKKLLEIKRVNFESEFSKIEEIAAALEEKLNRIKRIEQRDNTFWSLILHNEDSHALICDRINSAKKEALVFLDSIHSKELCTHDNRTNDDSQFLCVEDFKDAKDRGVDVKMLIDTKSICYEHINKHPDRIEAIKREKYNVRFASLDVAHFDVIDGESVLQHIVHPANKKKTIGTIIIKDKNLANALQNEFLKIWTAAKEI